MKKLLAVLLIACATLTTSVGCSSGSGTKPAGGTGGTGTK